MRTGLRKQRSTVTLEASPARRAEALDRVVIRFAGDSGDGMQLVGDRFTELSAVFGNDLATLPNFPAEIRAPAGTIAGVSSFQVHISDHEISTPGDTPNVLVAMNPAALKANLRDMTPGSTLLINVDAFDTRNLDKAGYESEPARDGSLAAFRVYEVPMTSITVEATKPLGVKPRDAERSKNFFALGLISWMYDRPTEPLDRVDQDALRQPHAGARGEQRRVPGRATTSARPPSCSTTPTRSSPRSSPPGTYRNITGNVALSYGLVAAAQSAKLPIFYASYPITPASDILHELSKLKNFGVKTLQAEDEIAAAGAAVGAAFAGSLAVTATSGPGVDLKAETIGLAISLELPLVLVDVQRGGPSTGLPTKTEQADLHARDVRPARRGAAADRRRAVAGRLLRRRVRGGAHRAEVPHAGDPPHRRLPRERRRAVEPARPRRAARHLGAVRDRAQPRRRLLAVPARPRDARAAVGDPGHAAVSCTASAASRRKTAPATSATTPRTTTR